MCTSGLLSPPLAPADQYLLTPHCLKEPHFLPLKMHMITSASPNAGPRAFPRPHYYQNKERKAPTSNRGKSDRSLKSMSYEKKIDSPFLVISTGYSPLAKQRHRVQSTLWYYFHHLAPRLTKKESCSITHTASPSEEINLPLRRRPHLQWFSFVRRLPL